MRNDLWKQIEVLPNDKPLDITPVLDSLVLSDIEGYRLIWIGETTLTYNEMLTQLCATVILRESIETSYEVRIQYFGKLTDTDRIRCIFDQEMGAIIDRAKTSKSRVKVGDII